MKRAWRTFVLIAAGTGVIALFLPAVAGRSVWTFFYWGLSDWFFSELAFRTVPLLLSIFILYWQVKARFGPPTRGEVIAAYVLSGAAMLSPLVPLVFKPELFPGWDQGITALAIALAAVAATNSMVRMRIRAGSLPRAALPESLLLGAYLPSAAYCIAMNWRHFEVGAYLLAAVGAAYAAAIVWLLHSGPDRRASPILPAGRA